MRCVEVPSAWETEARVGQSGISKVIPHPRPELLLGSAPWGARLPPNLGRCWVLSALSSSRFPPCIPAPGQPVPAGCCGASQQRSGARPRGVSPTPLCFLARWDWRAKEREMELPGGSL